MEYRHTNRAVIDSHCELSQQLIGHVVMLLPAPVDTNFWIEC